MAESSNISQEKSAKKMVAIQQPEHFPWLGFFNKMILADEFIYLDNVQFKKRYFENRNKVRANNADGWEWITVPVVSKGHYSQNINEVEIDYTQQWQRKYLRKISCFYGKTPFFSEIFGQIEPIINKKPGKLLELNLELIEFVRVYLGIATPAMPASGICEGNGSDLILGLCIKRNARAYLSGPDGRNYLKLDEFSKNNINVDYHDYSHCGYEQGYKPFISHMSVMDLLFNYGKGSIKVIKGVI